MLLLFLHFSFDLCLINFHHRATPNFLNILNYLSIYPSIHLAVFFSVNLSIDLFHSLNIKYNRRRPGPRSLLRLLLCIRAWFIVEVIEDSFCNNKKFIIK